MILCEGPAAFVGLSRIYGTTGYQLSGSSDIGSDIGSDIRYNRINSTTLVYYIFTFYSLIVYTNFLVFTVYTN